MKKRKIQMCLGLIVVIFMAMASVSQTLATDMTAVEKNGINDVIKSTMRPSGFKCKTMDLNLKKVAEGTSAAKPATLLTDLPIITSENDVLAPSITTDGSGSILVMAEASSSIFESDLAIKYSSDSGNSWLPGDGFMTFSIEGLEQSPCVDYTGSSEFQAYGSCMPDPLTNVLYIIHFPSMTDPEASWRDDDGWTVYQVDLSGNYEDFKGIDVCGYPYGSNAPAPDFHGTIAWTSTDVGTGLETFCILWEEEGTSLSLIYMEDVEGEVYDIAADIDLSTGIYYEAIEWKDAPGIIDDGIFVDFNRMEPGDPEWWMDEWGEVVFEGGANPDIVADGGNCYLVYESIDPLYGSKDISCAYSHDNGETFRTTTITQTPIENEYFPSVTAIGKTVICTYTRNGNLYTSISEDGGITWEESEEIINDEDGSVVEEYRSADIAGQYVAWVDNRGDSLDIYFDSVGISAPVLVIESVSGGFGVKATVANIGTADAENVEWNIVFDGPVFVGKEKSGTVTIPAGGEATISSGLILGIGPASITITVGGATKTASGFVLGPLVLGIK